MLGRKDYTREELDHGKAAVAQQLSAYRSLAKAGAGGAKPAAFETVYFNNMTIVLDRYFVHRVRAVAGKDGNPINEVELLADSLMSNDGVLRESSVIKLVPEQSVLKLQFGDPIKITEDDFDRLSAAFLAEMERRFL